MRDRLEHFVGKAINKAYINNDNSTMIWQVDGDWYKLDALGDCCSYSWYEHCDNGPALQDAVLTAFDSYNAENITEDDYTYIRVDMLKFQTGKGHCTIEFRNSSNGYYSGWCEVSALSKEPNLKGYKLLGDF